MYHNAFSYKIVINIYWLLKFTLDFNNIINITSGLEFVCGRRLEILNLFILE